MLCINEIQPVNRFTLFDQTQTAEPWIELHNPGTVPISLDPFTLSDNYYRFRQFNFPKGWTILPGQYLVLWMDGQPEQTTRTELHCGFRLRPEGGSLALSLPVNGVPTIVDYADYPRLQADLSFGLVPATPGTASVQRKVFIRPTPGAINIPLPAIAINELMIRPTGEPGWIELYNAEQETVDLGSLSLSITTAAGQTSAFLLPRGRRIPAGGFYRLYADDRTSLNSTDPLNIHLPWTLPTVTFTLRLSVGSNTVNQMTTKATSPTRSESRYPDGGVFQDYVNRPTPLEPNVGLIQWIQAPTSQILKQGTDFGWRVEALGSAPVSYRWINLQLPGQILATGPSFKIVSAKPSDSGAYRCIASNSAGTLTSDFRIDVLQLPDVVVQSPDEVLTRIGDKLLLPTGVGGTGPLQFQWKRNGMNLPSATRQDYLDESLRLEGGGSYTMVIRNGAGASLSVPIRVLIDAPQSEGSDPFEGRVPIAVRGEPSGLVRGSNRKATRQGGEPMHAGNTGGRSVWFSWTPTKGGIARLHTRGSTFDTLLAVYEGKAVNALKRVESDDDRGGYYTSDLHFNAERGVDYAIAIDGFGGDTNEFLLSWELESTTAQIPVILKHPLSQTAIPGSSVVFRVTASDDVVGYQWYFNGVLLRGATDDVLTLTKVGIPDIGLYSVRVVNRSQRMVESYAARLELGDRARQPSEDKYEPPFQPFRFPGLQGSDFPSQASIPTEFVSAGTIGSQWLTTRASATQLSEPPPCGAIGGSSRFQAFVLDASNDVIIDTIGSTYDTVLTIYSLGAAPPFQYVTCNASSSNSLVQFSGVAHTAYYAFVDAADGATPGITQLNWRVGGLPVLVSPAPPMTNSVDVGGEFSLPIAYAAQPSVSSVQWLLDDAPASGGDAIRLAVAGASPDNAGFYSVVLSNAMGSVTGAVASVHVQIPFQLGVSTVSGGASPDILLKGLADQGFWVEASTDLANWCSFAVHSAPYDLFSFTLTQPENHPRLFFRARPWPNPPSEPVTPCLPGFP